MKLGACGQILLPYLGCPVIPTQLCSWSAFPKLEDVAGFVKLYFCHYSWTSSAIKLNICPSTSAYVDAWILRSRSTSGRNTICPLGNQGYGFVHCGNVLFARMCLLCLVLGARRVRWLLEQPSSSCVADHPAFDWLLERVTAARRQRGEWVICHDWGTLEVFMFTSVYLNAQLRFTADSGTCAILARPL